MIKLLNKYGIEIKYKKSNLLKEISHYKSEIEKDGFDFEINNEADLFLYEVVLNGLKNKIKMNEEYHRFMYDMKDVVEFLNYEEKQKMINNVFKEAMEHNPHYNNIYIPYLEEDINEKYIHNYQMIALKQYQQYIKDWVRDIRNSISYYGYDILESEFSSLIYIDKDESYRYFYHDEFKKIYAWNDYTVEFSFPVCDKYYKGSIDINQLKEMMKYYNDSHAFVDMLYESTYYSEKYYKKIKKKMKVK